MAEEPSAKSGEACGRCGLPLTGGLVVVEILSGPLHAKHPVLPLCPACADSLTKWFVRGKSSRRAASAANAPTPSSSRRSSRSERRRRRSQRRRVRALTRRGVAIGIVFVVFAVVCLILYQSFVILVRFL